MVGYIVGVGGKRWGGEGMFLGWERRVGKWRVNSWDGRQLCEKGGVYNWSGSQWCERRGYIPGVGANHVKGEGMHLGGVAIGGLEMVKNRQG